MGAPAKAELTGVPETALWNLYQRASAARAGHLDDPRAAAVLARLDYPFERFDSPYGGLAARLHALRVRTVDAALRRVLADHMTRRGGGHRPQLLLRVPFSVPVKRAPAENVWKLAVPASPAN